MMVVIKNIPKTPVPAPQSKTTAAFMQDKIFIKSL